TAVCRSQPRVRRHAGRADRRDRDRARDPPRAVRRVAPANRRRMKAIVLAAGYATRLRPLTNTIAKPLLPIAERPLIDWILDKVDEAGEADAVHVVTNSRYAPDFERWAAWRDGARVRVHDDGTSS